jgi:hypothetical protein
MEVKVRSRRKAWGECAACQHSNDDRQTQHNLREHHKHRKKHKSNWRFFVVNDVYNGQLIVPSPAIGAVIVKLACYVLRLRRQS